MEFDSLRAVADLALPELVGCPQRTIMETASVVFADFCHKTKCYRASITVELESGVGKIELDAPYKNAVVIGIERVKVNGREVMAGEFYSHNYNEVTLVDEPDGECELELVLKHIPYSESVPKILIATYLETLAKGVKGKLMTMAGGVYPWADMQRGAAYLQEYEQDAHVAATDIKNGFNVSRVPRKQYTRSVYGF